MSWPKVTESLTSIAPAGFELPAWFDARPAHRPGQLGAPHIEMQSFSEYAGSRKPLFTVPFQPFWRAQSRYGLSQAPTGRPSNMATPLRGAADALAALRCLARRAKTRGGNPRAREPRG